MENEQAKADRDQHRRRQQASDRVLTLSEHHLEDPATNLQGTNQRAEADRGRKGETLCPEEGRKVAPAVQPCSWITSLLSTAMRPGPSDHVMW